jgi:hypothetical protein
MMPTPNNFMGGLKPLDKAIKTEVERSDSNESYEDGDFDEENAEISTTKNTRGIPATMDPEAAKKRY